MLPYSDLAFTPLAQNKTTRQAHLCSFSKDLFYSLFCLFQRFLLLRPLCFASFCHSFDSHSVSLLTFVFVCTLHFPPFLYYCFPYFALMSLFCTVMPYRSVFILFLGMIFGFLMNAAGMGVILIQPSFSRVFSERDITEISSVSQIASVVGIASVPGTVSVPENVIVPGIVSVTETASVHETVSVPGIASVPGIRNSTTHKHTPFDHKVVTAWTQTNVLLDFCSRKKRVNTPRLVTHQRKAAADLQQVPPRHPPPPQWTVRGQESERTLWLSKEQIDGGGYPPPPLPFPLSAPCGL